MNFTHNQDALKLSLDQVEVVLDVTINEARKLLVKARPDDTTTTSSDISRHKLIKSRVPLIVSCLNTSEKATKAMNYLQGKFFFSSNFSCMFLHPNIFFPI
jgi:hypothetical protein